jgi:prepilin-type N-terminal cleavage/methylation domain-containing protein
MMKLYPQRPRRVSAGFSLIEVIGVLAIMAIMASVLVPSAIKSVQEAAISAESQTLSNLGTELTLYLRDQGAVPTSANWTTALAGYANLSPSNLAVNSRQVARVYVTDPSTNPTQRVLLLSSMRANLALPTAANIGTAASFQQIWQTADGSVPPTTSWAGWRAWAAVANSGEYLIIERVNLLPIYDTDLASYTLTLNNHSSATASYNLVLANGTVLAAVNVAAGKTVSLANEIPRVMITLYSAAGGLSPNYTYVISTSGKTFDFDGTNWTPE